METLLPDEILKPVWMPQSAFHQTQAPTEDSPRAHKSKSDKKIAFRLLLSARKVFAEHLSIQCSARDMFKWDSDYGKMEAETNTFASFLLMPLDDSREQIDGEKISMDLVRHLSDRYEVWHTATESKKTRNSLKLRV